MTARHRARRRDPGFFALARGSRRALWEDDRQGGDGDDAAFYVVLASEADDGVLKIGSVADLATEFDLPTKRLRKRLHLWAEWGWIEWTPSTNGETPGTIRFLCNIERRLGTPDVTPDVASPSPLPTPPPDPSGVTRGNDPHREQGTVNSEERNGNGLDRFANRGTTWRRTWMDIIAQGLTIVCREALSNGALTGHARAYKRVEIDDGPDEARRALFDALTDMGRKGTATQTALEDAVLGRFSDHLDYVAARASTLDDLWCPFDWQQHDDGNWYLDLEVSP